MQNIHIKYGIHHLRHELMLVCMVLLYIFQFAVRSVLPAVYANDYMRLYHIDAYGIGVITSCFYSVYTIMQVPSGVITDRFGIKRISVISTLCCSFAMTMFYFSKSYYCVCFSHILLGFGASFALLIAFKILNEHFDKKRITIMTALILSCGALGPVVISPLITHVFSAKRLQDAMMFFLVFCYLLTIFNFIIVKYKKNHSVYDIQYDLRSLIRKIIIILCSRQVLLMFFITFFWRVPIVIIPDLWGASFLSKMYKITLAEGMFFSNIMYIGYVFGSFGMSWLASRIKSFKKPLMIGACIINISFGCVVFSHDISLFLMVFLFLLIGIGCGGILTYQAVFFIVPKSISATASSFINAGAMLCSVILQPLFGYLIKKNWDGKCVCGIPNYSIESFQSALTVMFAFSVVVLFLIPLMRDTYRAGGGRRG